MKVEDEDTGKFGVWFTFSCCALTQQLFYKFTNPIYESFMFMHNHPLTPCLKVLSYWGLGFGGGDTNKHSLCSISSLEVSCGYFFLMLPNTSAEEDGCMTLCKSWLRLS